VNDVNLKIPYSIKEVKCVYNKDHGAKYRLYVYLCLNCAYIIVLFYS
jgi:hypothetical protein